ncbi:MAG: hypothetical protein ACE1Z4_03090, partial [Gammaproteobacteria bacterium]
TTIFLAIRGVAREKLTGKVTTKETADNNPVISLPCSMLLFGIFVWAGREVVSGAAVFFECVSCPELRAEDKAE